MKFLARLRTLLVLFIGFFASFSVWATAPDPLNMLQNISNQMISELKNNKAVLKSNPNITYNIINQILLPHVDALGMSKAVLGQTVWLKVSATEREDFNKEFKRLLIRTYATAFSNYDDQEIKFLPMRDKEAVSTGRVQINSMILQNDGPKVPVNYRLAKINEDWKIYDISVDGVSLLQSYRAQFASELSHIEFKELLEKLKKG